MVREGTNRAANRSRLFGRSWWSCAGASALLTALVLLAAYNPLLGITLSVRCNGNNVKAPHTLVNQTKSYGGRNPYDFALQSQAELLAESQEAVPSKVQKCPAWFVAIRDDLAPWQKRGGITIQALENTIPYAHFRFQIISGELWVERYEWTPDPGVDPLHGPGRGLHPNEYLRFYTAVWGILQLLRRYPGQVPDVDAMMEVFDYPRISRIMHFSVLDPPLLLKFCSTPSHMDVPWPDWSFWGWAEIHMPPWALELESILEGTKRAPPWEKRPPRAWWRGGSEKCPARKRLFECADPNNKWGAEIYHAGWVEKNVTYSRKVEDQCTHRFKLYAEGWTWSSSAKYIMACDAAAIVMETKYYEFWYRGLQAGKHFLAVAKENLCANIKSVVDWGNKNAEKAKEIGENGSKFIKEEVSMPMVYDYMLHTLREYASLQRFIVTPSPGAVKITTPHWLLHNSTDWKKFNGEVASHEDILRVTLVEKQTDRPPCLMDWSQESPLPYPFHVGLDTRPWSALGGGWPSEGTLGKRTRRGGNKTEEKGNFVVQDAKKDVRPGARTVEKDAADAKLGGLWGAKLEKGSLADNVTIVREEQLESNSTEDPGQDQEEGGEGKGLSRLEKGERRRRVLVQGNDHDRRHDL